jgi:hypothetical protein
MSGVERVIAISRFDGAIGARELAELAEMME